MVLIFLFSLVHPEYKGNLARPQPMYTDLDNQPGDAAYSVAAALCVGKCVPPGVSKSREPIHFQGSGHEWTAHLMWGHACHACRSVALRL